MTISRGCVAFYLNVCINIIKLNRTRSHAKRTLNEMFHLFMNEPDVLPTDWFELVCAKDTETARARVICDYIAGMTDAFAIEEHRRLFSFGG